MKNIKELLKAMKRMFRKDKELLKAMKRMFRKDNITKPGIWENNSLTGHSFNDQQPTNSVTHTTPLDLIKLFLLNINNNKQRTKQRTKQTQIFSNFICQMKLLLYKDHNGNKGV